MAGGSDHRVVCGPWNPSTRPREIRWRWKAFCEGGGGFAELARGSGLGACGISGGRKLLGHGRRAVLRRSVAAGLRRGAIK